jgi:hypothetical protein
MFMSKWTDIYDRSVRGPYRLQLCPLRYDSEEASITFVHVSKKCF